MAAAISSGGRSWPCQLAAAQEGEIRLAGLPETQGHHRLVIEGEPGLDGTPEEATAVSSKGEFLALMA